MASCVEANQALEAPYYRRHTEIAPGAGWSKRAEHNISRFGAPPALPALDPCLHWNPIMGKDKDPKPPRQDKMDQFTKTITPQNEGRPGARSDTDTLLQAINASKSALERQIGAVGTEVSLLRQELRNLADRVKETETQLGETEDSVHELQKDMKELQSSHKDLLWRVDDAENRARRNNLRFVGFKEGIEGTNMPDFLHNWLRNTFPSDKFSPCFIIERTHRALMARPPPECNQDR